MNLASRVELGDGARMPWFGVGLYKVAPPEIEPLVDAALGLGHRLFDTATMYKNELALGSALSASGVPREDVFLTTKVLNADHGFDRTREACHESLDRLGTDYLDLYLIHWPAPTQNRFIETWEALVSLREEGLVRSIGVANFHVHHLDRLAERGLPAPVLNQVECHPWLPQEACGPGRPTAGSSLRPGHRWPGVGSWLTQSSGELRPRMVPPLPRFSWPGSSAARWR